MANIFEKRVKAWEAKHRKLLPEVQRKINSLVAQYDKNLVVDKNSYAIKISEGTKLIREFKGKKHSVTVVSSGYEYNGQSYKSLSAIANKITGTRWNGKKFFGVAK